MRQVSRRSFFKFCSVSAAGLALDPFDIVGLNRAMANPNGPKVLWLQGTSCTGCSMSFLNYISPTAPTTAADVLINYINLAYHPNLMAAAGQTAADVIQQAKATGNFILVVEGGIPTKWNGGACYAWTSNGVEVTFADAVRDLAARASKILCFGACSSFGGVPAAPPNPAGVVSVKTLTGRSTINVSGCPPHPNWMVWTIVQLLQNKAITLDSYGRPTTIYGRKLHDNCPYKGMGETHTFGVPNKCLKELGCRGPSTQTNCQSLKWNNAQSWCIEAGAPCIGCTSPTYPGTSRFFRQPM